ncbi:hypothetical protein H106_03848 [Trichophyton rubrum CBS 735.88]|nr:hypothetical protein H106_03848 [Trichophyton rubrum CBS 735.88]
MTGKKGTQYSAYREETLFHVLCLLWFAQPSFWSPLIAIGPKCLFMVMSHPRTHANNGSAFYVLATDISTFCRNYPLHRKSKGRMHAACFINACIKVWKIFGLSKSSKLVEVPCFSGLVKFCHQALEGTRIMQQIIEHSS